MKDYNMHVIPHMHWDREWYFTTEESRILLVNNMQEIISRLETDPNYETYLLDGQTAILEDYFDVRPDMKDRATKLIKEGRLIVGPWYTQTDEIQVGAESITRNLLYGFKDSRAFGVEPMKIGYLPDSFGQTEQLPTIMNGFGIERTVFWRGATERHGTDRTEFIWKSLDGSETLNQILPLGYAIGKYLPQEPVALKKRMDTYVKVLKGTNSGKDLILPHGHDQMPIQKDIFEVMDILNEMYPEIDFKMSSYDQLFDALEKNKGHLDTIVGEFIDGKFMRVHRSISSTRNDIKYLSALLENKTTNILEPLAALAYEFGFEYQHGLIENIWKEMMKNHAHDSIGCCCSDIVHHEILARFLWASNAIDQLVSFYQRKIADHIENPYSNDKIVIYNLSPRNRSEIAKVKVRSRIRNFELLDVNGKKVDFVIDSREEIDPGLVDRQIVHYGVYDPFIEYFLSIDVPEIGAMGYTTLFLKPLDGDSVAYTTQTDTKIENDKYLIKVNVNGSLNIIDKENKINYDNVLLIEEGSDDGDEYDYSPLRPGEELLLSSTDVKADVIIEKSDLTETALIRYSMNVPMDLEERKQRLLNGHVDFTFKVELDKYSDVIRISTTINNQANDHRIRTLIPTGIASSISIADQQFGMIERPVYDTAQDVWEEEGWKEKPVDIYSMMTHVGLSNDNKGMSLITNGLREYEIVGEDYDTIALTLLRGVGVLGKEKLYYRPGRPSGIKMPTPDSQMIGEYTFNFGLYAHAKSTEAANVTSVARDYLTEVISYNENGYNAMKLNKEEIIVPSAYSLLSMENEEIVLSVVKKHESEDGLIIRLFNPSRRNVNNQTITFNKEIKYIELVNLNEEKIEEMDVEQSITLDFKPCQPKTIYVEFK